MEQSPDNVLIDGALINEDCSMQPFYGTPSDIRYGSVVLVKHRGKDYTIRRSLNGGMEVL